MKKFISFLFIPFALCSVVCCFPFFSSLSSSSSPPSLLLVFKKAFPGVVFNSTFDVQENDWLLQIEYDGRSLPLYWADAKLLPKEELPQKAQYGAMLYTYPGQVADPKDFSKEDIQKIREFSSPKNRQKGKGTPAFFFDFIFDTKTRASVEKHITTIQFLGKKSNVHEYIKPILKDIELQIKEAAKTDKETQDFIETLASADSYVWRNIGDSGNRSLHSMGLAIDLLPKAWGTKNIYWAWRRDIDGDDWMLLPLDRRWMPPPKVIEIFEENGFIWGGKWMIWDDMHFEYRPEILEYTKVKK